MREVTYSQRLFAGVWFAVAGAIPTTIAFLFVGEWMEIGRDNFGSEFSSLFTYLFYLLLPILAAGVSGCTFGAMLMKPNFIPSSPRAVWQGIMVGLLFYILFAFALSIGYTILFAIGGSTRNPIDNFLGMLGIASVGAVMFGWLVLLVGGLAGWVLFRIRISQNGLGYCQVVRYRGLRD